MSPHNDDVSAPAGVPHLQDAGYTITYEDVHVTAQFLQEMKAEIKAADDRAKYGLFRTRLFYGNLRRWQRQGLHCIYTNGVGTEHCTCGLVLHEHGNYYQEIAVKVTKSVEDKLDGIKLEQIHLAWGHRELPSLKGESVALIVGFIYKEEIGEYLWTSICQRCGDFQIEVKNDDAKSFVNAHNKICGSAVTKKKGN